MEYQNNKLRHELKYFINTEQHLHLKSLIKNILHLDKNADENGNYHIRSLYFDDIYDTAFNEKNAGIFKREKFRIRIYNFSKNGIKLESKKKFGEYISKTSENITLEEYENIMEGNYSFLSKRSGLCNSFYRKIIDNVLRPKVIVDYQREAYILDIGEVRITFDKDLSAGFNTNNIFDTNISNVSIYDKSHLVLEVKYNEFLPDYVKKILGTVSAKQLAASKYVMCRAVKNNIYC